MEEKNYTSNGIEYESEMSLKRCRMILYPILGKDEEEDVRIANSELRRTRKPFSIQVRWKRSDDSSENPQKLPDSVIIKDLMKKVGEQEAYIQELEYKESIISPEERAELKKTKIYQEQKDQIRKLEKTIKGLRKDKEDLIIVLNRERQERATQLK